jgi:putative ABC transport system permease protein
MARGQRVSEALKAGARSSHSRSHWRVLRGLVVAEVALSVVLLLGAGLLIHSLINLQRVDPGFRPGPVLTLNVPLPPAKYGQAGQRAFLERLETALLAVPGVEAVGVNDTLPFVKATNAGNVSSEKGDARSTGAAVDVRTHVVTSGYFQAMGIPLVAGGTFPPAEADACIISQRLAQRLWPGQDAVGRLLYSGFSDPLRVVGVVGDTAENMLGKAEDPQVYQPAAFSGLFEGPVVVMKVKGDPGQYRSQMKAVLRSLDPGLALPEPKPLAQVLRESLMMQSVASTLFALFGLLALLLSGVGLYGVLAQVGEQKHREIGIRMSLGATRLQVVGGVLRGASLLVGSGLVLGAVLGWRLELALGPLLFGLKGAGPLIYLGILLFLVPTALLACLIPALRAARVDPSEALRSE